MEHYVVGWSTSTLIRLRIRRWGSPSDVAAVRLFFKTGDIIFAKRRAYQRKLGVAEFDGICSAHAMVLRAKPEVVAAGVFAFLHAERSVHESGGGNFGGVALADDQLEN